MELTQEDKKAIEEFRRLSSQTGLKVAGGKVRRSSSRFCLGIEHGDYNGTELFGVGTDRFIWLASRGNGTDRVRLFSANFPEDDVIEFQIGCAPPARSKHLAHSWGRFPCGVDYILKQNGYNLRHGIDGIVYGNIPGGGMSRSASLSLNLILSILDVNDIEIADKFKIVKLAQAVENDYIGSPCGMLDQIMILFARERMGTHYNPGTQKIEYVPLASGAGDFRIVVLDTGTDRPGLEKSTYKIRRDECELFVSKLKQGGYQISCLADVREENLYNRIMAQFQNECPDLCDRLNYIYHAQERFSQLLEAWKAGDIETVGGIFRADGIGLRDDYRISGPELETMCDIARTVPGVLGERMLGGGDKGAAGALVRADSVPDLQQAVNTAYPRSYPKYADKFAVHVCKPVEGITVMDGI